MKRNARIIWVIMLQRGEGGSGTCLSRRQGAERSVIAGGHYRLIALHAKRFKDVDRGVPALEDERTDRPETVPPGSPHGLG